MAGQGVDEHRHFERLYHANYRRVVGFLSRRLHPDVVDDATSEVFAIAWRRRADVPDEPIGWLIGVASNVIAQHYRAKSRLERLIEEERTRAIMARPGDMQQQVADRIASITALLSLAEQDRDAILLIAWDSLTMTEAAGAADCSPGTFRVRLSRARTRLRAALAEAEDAPEFRYQHDRSAT